jgi:hypothetical protein
MGWWWVSGFVEWGGGEKKIGNVGDMDIDLVTDGTEHVSYS